MYIFVHRTLPWIESDIPSYLDHQVRYLNSPQYKNTCVLSESFDTPNIPENSSKLHEQHFPFKYVRCSTMCLQRVLPQAALTEEQWLPACDEPKLRYFSFLSLSCASAWGEDPWSTSSPHRVREMPTHHRAAWVSPKITFPRMAEEMKLDAVVVTVALAEEEQCRRALEKKVHMTALQMNSRPPHSSRRGTWSQSQARIPPCASVQLLSPDSHMSLR